MKITVSRSLLSDALTKVKGLASGKGTPPILSNVKIEAEGQKATFTTTDLDITVVIDITCHVIESGAITLPARLLSDAIARSSEGDVSIEVNNATGKATIHAGSSVYKIVGLPADDFPHLPAMDGDETEVSIPQEVMKSMFRRTVFAMSQDDTRMTLKGTFLKFAEGYLTCVATDGRRLAIAEYHPDEAYPIDLSFILPAKAVAELSKHLGSAGDIKIMKCNSQIKAVFDNGIVIYTKLVDSAYPNYLQVIPKNNDNIVMVDRASLIASLERVGIFSESFAMKFEFANNELKLGASTPNTGNGEETVPVKYEGTPIVAAFNYDYILDALKASDDDEIKFAFKDGTSPVVVNGSLPGLVIIMPLRING